MPHRSGGEDNIAYGESSSISGGNLMVHMDYIVPLPVVVAIMQLVKLVLLLAVLKIMQMVREVHLRAV